MWGVRGVSGDNWWLGGGVVGPLYCGGAGLHVETGAGLAGVVTMAGWCCTLPPSFSGIKLPAGRCCFSFVAQFVSLGGVSASNHLDTTGVILRKNFLFLRVSLLLPSTLT